ncbi:phage major capsid protein [Zavarzinella formosa]|uniref:phage major capsid protein n=1 Tax=Zavarzinella formosa TaxID=360055 RepID=UPI0002F79D05|nr:phage major capsid protein [Zavarzinella formosa]
MTAELTKSVETALSAFNEYKGMVEGFDKKLKDISPKLDAFDQTKLDKLEKAMGDAVEATQKADARVKALETEQKAKEEAFEAALKAGDVKLQALEIAFNRAPAAGATDEKGREAALRKKAFNDFARMRSENREGFTEYLEKRGEDNAEIKALSVNSDSSGGYLTMPEMGGIIQTRVFETSPMRQLATVTNIGGDTYEVILDNDEASSGWVGETAPRPNTTTPTVGKLTIYCNEMYANPKATQKILDDAGIDIEAWLAQKVADKFARDEATAFVTGNGVNKPKGLLSYDAGTTITSQQIEQIVTGSATTFTYDGLVDLQNALKEPYQSNASFLIQRATNRHLMKIKDGEGQPVFNMAFDKNVGLQSTLMTRPYYFAADMPAVTTNALAMAYGDIRTAYQIVDRMGIRVLRDPYTDKPNVAFYTTKRVGGGVVNFEAVKLSKVST